MTNDALQFQHGRTAPVKRLVQRVQDCVESISLGFDRYEEEHVNGPGLYVAIVSGHSVEGYADPMGDNAWPIDTCEHVFEDVERFCAAATTVATRRDGGVVVSISGAILEQMVRFRDVGEDELDGGTTLADVEYADWMGARHMSAYETSLRPEVVTAITLSEESGRVTTFSDGEYVTVAREDVGQRWR